MSTEKPDVENPASEPLPKSAGYYWAKWHTASGSDPTGDLALMANGERWEVVLVERFLFYDDVPVEESLFVRVHGVEPRQDLKEFHWGPRIPDLPGVAEARRQVHALMLMAMNRRSRH